MRLKEDRGPDPSNHSCTGILFPNVRACQCRIGGHAYAVNQVGQSPCAAAAAVKAKGLTSVGLLGTRFTMEMDFYRKRLEKDHGLSVLVPDAPEREIVHAVIYDELGRGIVREESRRAYVGIIEGLVRRGAQGVILGCTEIPLLIKEKDSPVPVFDTTALHAAAAVDFALG